MNKWYEDPGTPGSNVIYSRIRLVRNWREYPFPGKMTREQSAEMTGKLYEGLAGIGSLEGKKFRFAYLDRMADLEKTALAHLPFCLVASRQHPIAQLDAVGQEDCRDAEFVILSKDTLEQEHARRLMPTQARIAAEVSSTQVALRFVKRNVGVHFTDRLAAKSVSNDCKLIDLKEPLTIPFYVFWPKAAGRIDPAVFECTREIAASIKAAGIELTPEGEGFLREQR